MALVQGYWSKAAKGRYHTRVELSRSTVWSYVALCGRELNHLYEEVYIFQLPML